MQIPSTNDYIKTNFYENRRPCFLIKKENVFIKYMEILLKVRSIIKTKFNSELIYNKEYLKAKTNKQTNKHT